MVSGCLPQLLSKLPCFLVHDGRMDGYRNKPIFRCVKYRIFVSVRFLVRTEVDRVPHIVRFGKYLSHYKATPVVGMRKVIFAFPCPVRLPRLMDSRRLHLFVMEDKVMS